MLLAAETRDWQGDSKHLINSDSLHFRSSLAQNRADWPTPHLLHTLETRMPDSLPHTATEFFSPRIVPRTSLRWLKICRPHLLWQCLCSQPKFSSTICLIISVSTCIAFSEKKAHADESQQSLNLEIPDTECKTAACVVRVPTEQWDVKFQMLIKLILENHRQTLSVSTSSTHVNMTCTFFSANFEAHFYVYFTQFNI